MHPYIIATCYNSVYSRFAYLYVQADWSDFVKTFIGEINYISLSKFPFIFAHLPTIAIFVCIFDVTLIIAVLAILAAILFSIHWHCQLYELRSRSRSPSNHWYACLVFSRSRRQSDCNEQFFILSSMLSHINSSLLDSCFNIMLIPLGFRLIIFKYFTLFTVEKMIGTKTGGWQKNKHMMLQLNKRNCFSFDISKKWMTCSLQHSEIDGMHPLIQFKWTESNHEFCLCSRCWSHFILTFLAILNWKEKYSEDYLDIESKAKMCRFSHHMANSSHSRNWFIFMRISITNLDIFGVATFLTYPNIHLLSLGILCHFSK